MKHKPNTYLAQNLDCLRNGSFYRITGRKREYAAHYILGDFHDFVTEAELPADRLPVILSRREAVSNLPACCR